MNDNHDNAATDREMLERHDPHALTRSLLKGIGLGRHDPPHRLDMALSPYSDETRIKIIRAIELNPVGEALILDIAELAFADGFDSATED